MLVLGINGNFGTESADLVPGMPDYYFHDAAACLVRDGELVAAVEEERLNRIKKTTKFPVNAVRSCLDAIGAEPGDVDAVGYYFDREFTDHALNNWYAENPGTPLRYARRLIGDRLHDGLGWRPAEDRLVFTEHHVCHARSALARSGTDEALVVVLDARGEEHSGTVFRGAGQDLTALGRYSIAQSLGTFYEAAINLIGYRFGDEYKVMGLAPYGDPGRYREVFDGLCRLGPDGGYELNPGSPEMNLVCPAFFANGFLPRRKGEPLTQQHMDFAAGLQDALERIVLHVLGHWARTTGLRKLCFTGGVAHNSSLNGLILRSGLFDEVFVHPAAHDAGAAEGAALSAARRLGAA
ncbi:carbamoyltransferase, partial [Amycolatopsis rubida]